MFTKKNIIKHTKILLTLLVFHFLLTTFLRYELWYDLHIYFLNNSFVNLWKDFYLIFIYFLIFVYAYRNNFLYKLKNKFIYVFILLLFLSVVISLLHFRWFSSIIFWFKYDLWLFFPVIFYYLLDFDKKDINRFYNFFINLIKITIVLSIIFEIIRFFLPEALYILWYWELWNWWPNVKPPVFYETWFDWIERVSWIFSWPNHLAFYFIAFGPLILLSILNKKLNYIWWILYLVLLIWSLSRSAIVALFVELFIISLFIYKYYWQYRNLIKKFFIAWFVLFSMWFLYLFISWKYHQIILRWASTKGHFDKSKEWFLKILEKPITWYWLASAWPASYHTKNPFIPESWILQIFDELWIFVWFLWFYFLYLILKKLKENTEITYPYLTKKSIFKIWIIVWVIWLLVQWLFLHSFEDSMIVIPLFIIIWILISW